jgi:hypothetical protein
MPVAKYQIDSASQLGKLFKKLKLDYQLVGKFTRLSHKHSLKHSCGLVSDLELGRVLIGHKKCSCLHVKTGPKPITKEAFVKQLRKKKGYTLVGPFRDKQTLTRFKHTCGRTFDMLPETLLDVGKCPCLRLTQKEIGLQEHRKEVRKWRSKDFDCLKYMPQDGQSTYKHLVCGKTWKSSRSSFRGSKHCPHCVDVFATNRHTQKQAEKIVKGLHGKEYKIGEYLGVGYDLEVTHVPCGKVYKTRGENILRGGALCSDCFPSTRGSRVKEIEIQGRVFRVQGYEPLSLPKLVKLYSSNNIVTGSQPDRFRIDYYFNVKRHSYYPDFYIPNRRRIIEVKSLFTLGLNHPTYNFFGDNLYERNCAKASECIRKGYSFFLHLYNENQQRIKVPYHWYKMSRNDLLVHLGYPPIGEFNA